MFTPLFIFLVIGGIGFLFLMVSLIIGDVFEALDLDFGADADFDTDVDLDADVDFDADVDADLDAGSGSQIGILDARVISMFMTAFGFVGSFALYGGLGVLLSTFVGLGSGVIFGGLAFAFGYFLTTQESSSSVTDRDLIGRTAKVIVGIQPDSIGQISCRIGEERIEKLARTRDGKAIKRGETVFIEEVTSDSFIVSTMEGTGYELLSE